VKADQTVESRPVTTGPQVQEEMVIQSGLAEGETVVVEGQLRLAPGSRVQPAGIPESPHSGAAEPQKTAGKGGK
jgi:multidrug efflux system membrane fusion protein